MSVQEPGSQAASLIRYPARSRRFIHPPQPHPHTSRSLNAISNRM
jgi:hypothetical protein